jgi:peptidoglycan hydrolase-like protein with peptidoglycan-binding domain
VDCGRGRALVRCADADEKNALAFFSERIVMVLGITTEYQTGSSGASVKQIQAALAFAGYLQTAPDGLYGPLTKQAVQRFQSDKGLTIDGIVGPNTWAALMGGSPVPVTPPALIRLPKAGPVPSALVLPVGASAQLFDSLTPVQMIAGGLGLLLLASVGLKPQRGGRKTRTRR